MSVDYYSCDVCRRSIYEEYVGSCTHCGHSLCTQCVVNDDIESDYAFRYGEPYDGSEAQKLQYGIEDGWYNIGDIIDDTSIQPKYCPFCNGDNFAEDDLLEFALSKLEVTKEELIDMYRTERF